MWEASQRAPDDTCPCRAAGHIVIVAAANFQHLYHALLPRKENIIELLAG
jgi:hypothetical protein